MKKIFFIFLLLLFTVPLVCAHTIIIENVTTFIDSEIQVPIIINESESIAGGVVNISFDPLIVLALDVTSGDFGTPTVKVDNESGWIKIVAAVSEAVNKSEAHFANIIFKGICNGTTDLLIEYVSLNNETGELITPTISNGSITVNLSYGFNPETISIGSMIMDVNDTVVLPVSIANAVDIQQVTIDLVYDPDVISIINITANDTVPSSTVTYTLNTGSAAIELTNPDNITVTSATPVIDVTFQAGENTSVTVLDLQNVEVVDNTGSHSPDTVVDGSLTVCIKGDFNNNDKVDIGDVARVAFMVAEKVPEDLRADFNNNGCVDVGDAAKISFYLAKKVDEL